MSIKNFSSMHWYVAKTNKLRMFNGVFSGDSRGFSINIMSFSPMAKRRWMFVVSISFSDTADLFGWITHAFFLLGNSNVIYGHIKWRNPFETLLQFYNYEGEQQRFTVFITLYINSKEFRGLMIRCCFMKPGLRIYKSKRQQFVIF